MDSFSFDAYAILDVPRDASEIRIKLAFEKALRRFQSKGWALIQEHVLGKREQDIRHAASVLSDPVKRRAHDAWLRELAEKMTMLPL